MFDDGMVEEVILLMRDMNCDVMTQLQIDDVLKNIRFCWISNICYDISTREPKIYSTNETCITTLHLD
jgi:hypothetical protein